MPDAAGELTPAEKAQLDQAEAAMLQAKAAYQKKQTDSNKDAHRAASQALADLRTSLRADRPVTGVGGDATPAG